MDHSHFFRLALILVLGFLPGIGFADQLNYYVYPSPLGISWKTPGDLVASTFENEALDWTLPFNASHAIGHVNMDLTCDPSPANPNGVHIMVGQTSAKNSKEDSEIFSEGYGLGVILAPDNGVWETAAQISSDLPERFKTGYISFINFQISPESCARVVSYLNEYQAKEYDKIYGGLEDRPRYGEGAGCTAFGEAVLEIAGIMAPEWYDYWSNFVMVPNELIGGPGTGRDVSVWDGLFGPYSGSWGKPGDSYPLTFWDPDRMYGWIVNASLGKMPKLTGMTYTSAKNEAAYGVDIDARELPTPQDSFWK